MGQSLHGKCKPREKAKEKYWLSRFLCMERKGCNFV